MTSAALQAPARSLPATRAHRIATTVLIVGTVLALTAALGPVWLARLGVVVALAALVTTSVVSGRELAAERRRHAAVELASSKAHASALRDERASHSSVLQVLTDRNRLALVEIERQGVALTGLRRELDTARGNLSALRADLRRRTELVEQLRTAVRAREAELVALRTAQPDPPSEVRAMPRRVLVDDEPGAGPQAPERWSGSFHPTVVDLPPIDASFRGEPVLPNYEGDRRPA